MRRLGSAAAAVVGLALALEALPWVLRWLRAGRRRPRREVLFFPSRVTCTEALLRAPGAPAGSPAACQCSLPHCESSLSRLLRALLAARASLELCLFAFSSPQLGRAVQLLHQRGVRVRAVTDCDYMALNGSQIGLLRKAGIQVRHDQDLGYMHHKFAIVDKKVLITGSLNWTTQAIQNNRENVLIMEDEEYVRLFLEEFERIWEEFNPTKYTFFPQKKRSPRGCALSSLQS
ncbi:PREDICTED: mitochondrial cardiolipin hydrolase [Propithecus coquereli]|uniref:mitochondrial cardiolipin hydrolase n=1 Tax=Propithecus coquereli TaxID=379532 RepID=UPI00063FA389|nr:PREDICTED: mitochondrial cardiolipin hydrolase [Propithecus coquereli]